MKKVVIVDHEEYRQIKGDAEIKRLGFLGVIPKKDHNEQRCFFVTDAYFEHNVLTCIDNSLSDGGYHFREYGNHRFKLIQDVFKIYPGAEIYEFDSMQELMGWIDTKGVKND